MLSLSEALRVHLIANALERNQECSTQLQRALRRAKGTHARPPRRRSRPEPQPNPRSGRRKSVRERRREEGRDEQHVVGDAHHRCDR